MNKRNILINTLLDGIRNGELVKNGQLPSERELAVQLGVSRVLLREAIVALEILGVVERKERLGIFVKGPDLTGVAESLRIMPYWSEDFVPQLIEVRLMIDVYACELAAMRRTEEHLEKLERCFSTLSEKSFETPEEAKESARFEFIFHMLIVEAAQNDVLTRIYEGLSALMEKNNEMLHESLTRDASWGRRVIEHHMNILKAIREEDAESANNWMRTHIVETRDRYQGILEKAKLILKRNTN